ncbi:GNAT family N-acetyltransferase [Streptomyces sp. ISL-11]|uniref:GNAT family N-acetyltransferase n=1 Tax=Streptomyces sp. ISL-11 TaxID=2819174 RepID=UPI001BE6A129|nr:GNAT family N-acetyltransferase [Streptomyces sp. ISL-11]MBT2384710.1 GNAT family N-acetyltransferase [Streptomyces sp. ISL-11]
MVILRVLTPDDWPLWRDVRLAALADAPHAFRSRLSDWRRGGEERWRARLTIPGAYHVVAMMDGRAVGVACGLPGDGGVDELRSLWVGPGLRGNGVGDQLMAAVEAWALRTGATALRLAVVPGNAPAIALYRRHGFAATGEPGDPLPDGATRELVMAKTLRRIRGAPRAGTGGRPMDGPAPVG